MKGNDILHAVCTNWYKYLYALRGHLCMIFLLCRSAADTAPGVAWPPGAAQAYEGYTTEAPEPAGSLSSSSITDYRQDAGVVAGAGPQATEREHSGDH